MVLMPLKTRTRKRLTATLMARAATRRIPNPRLRSLRLKNKCNIMLLRGIIKSHLNKNFLQRKDSIIQMP